MSPTPATPVMTHDWVKYTVQSVGVIVDPFTGDFMVVDVPSAGIGEQVGCSVCGDPLTVTSAQAKCTGEVTSLLP